jgi:hypothetical protein
VPHPNPPWINSTLLDAVHAELTAKPEIKLIFDDPTRLAEFNEGAIYYAHRHVYCSRAHVVGAVVE